MGVEDQKLSINSKFTIKVIINLLLGIGLFFCGYLFAGQYYFVASLIAASILLVLAFFARLNTQSAATAAVLVMDSEASDLAPSFSANLTVIVENMQSLGSLWSENIKLARSKCEEAIVELNSEFFEISSELDNIIKADESGTASDRNIVETITDSNTKICPEACPQTVAHTVKAVGIVFSPDDDRRICQGLASDHDVAMIGTAIAMHDVEGFTLQKAAQAPDL